MLPRCFPFGATQGTYAWMAPKPASDHTPDAKSPTANSANHFLLPFQDWHQSSQTHPHSVVDGVWPPIKSL